MSYYNVETKIFTKEGTRIESGETYICEAETPIQAMQRAEMARMFMPDAIYVRATKVNIYEGLTV